MTHLKSTGIGSTGDCSTGDYSTGDWSTGNCSTGNGSTGYCSTGDDSIGNYSTGNYSTGHSSTGHWSISDRSTGHFSTEDGQLTVFDKPCTADEWRDSVKPAWIYKVRPTRWVLVGDMTDEKKEGHPEYETRGDYLNKVPMKEAWRKAWNEADEKDRFKTLQIINFDNEKFKMISGIDVEKELGVNQPESAAPQTVVVDGRTYKLVDETL